MSDQNIRKTAGELLANSNALKVRHNAKSSAVIFGSMQRCRSRKAPPPIALAFTIEQKRKDYYAALKHNNKDVEITNWLTYFAKTVLEAQAVTMRGIDFHFAERLRGQTECQEKVIAGMFRESIDGFKRGLSA